MSMGRGFYIVRKHCEWSFTAHFGLVVKAQEVRCWRGDHGEEDGNIPRLHVCYMGLGTLALVYFCWPLFMYIFIDIAFDGHGKLF